MANEIVVLITTGSTEEAQKLGKELVQAKLAACVNVIPEIISIFNWHDEVCEEGEVLMIVKTSGEKFSALEKKIKQEHSYEVPEIIALPIVAGSKEYLNWIQKETRT